MLGILLSPLYLLINIYLFILLLRYYRACNERLKHPIIFYSSIVIYIFFALTPLIGYLLPDGSMKSFFMQIGSGWLGVLQIGITFIFFVEIFRLILNKTKWKNNHPNKKRHIYVGSIVIVLIVTLSVFGFIHGGKTKVTEGSVDIEKNFDAKKMKVILVADLHIGYNMSTGRIEEMVDNINKENPDLVIYAGDIFDNNYDAITDPEIMIQALKKVKSTYGSYGVWGNHDLDENLFVGFTLKPKEGYKEDQRYYNFMKEANINLINDKSLLIDNKFYLIGRDDRTRVEKLGLKEVSLNDLTKDLDKTKPIFLIDHQPTGLEDASKEGVDIDFSGHTHNGQMIPGVLVTKIMWDNAYGIKKVGNMYSIVTSGFGVWGPAMRLGTDSEIMAIEVNYVD